MAVSALKKLTCSLALCLCVLAAGPGNARAARLPTLEEILNATQRDVRSSPELPRAGDAKTVDVRRDAPVGQTFRTGEKVSRIVRIALWIAGWDRAWQPDESLVLTLYDGPERRRRLAQALEPYSRRHWEGAVHLFSLDAAAEPNHDYYFELTVQGGNGLIRGVALARRDYVHGARYQAGRPADGDLWFEVHVKRTADRDTLYRRVFEDFDLHYPGMEAVGAALARKDWERAKRALVDYFEHRADFPKPPALPKGDPKSPDDRNLIAHADLIVAGKWQGVDEIVDLGPRWNHFAAWRTRGGVGLTRTGLRSVLAGAYRRTREERYAEAWDAMLRYFFYDVPSPLRAGVLLPEARDISPTPEPGMGGGSMWASLSIGARMNHAFAYYAVFAPSPHFTLDTRFAFIADLAEMADVLEKMKAGGNWEAQNTTALFEFGRTFPEFKKARGWIARGFAGAASSCLENTYPDGPLREATINYHNLSLNRYLSLIEQAGKAGLAVPPLMRARVEKMLEYTLYATMPDWQLPQWGDSNPPADGLSLLLRGAKVFHRPDMLWVATKGKEGVPPGQASVSFPQAGYYILRSGWDRDARFLMIHNGHSSAHGHFDANSLVLTAYGAQMILDPGVYIYGTDEARELTATRSHSTLTADDRDTVNDGGPAHFFAGDLLSLYDGATAGYKGLKGARHRRRVLYVRDGAKRDFFLIADDAGGEAPHDWALRFRLGDGKAAARSGSWKEWQAPSGGHLSLVSRCDSSLEERIAAGGWERLRRLPTVVERQSGVPSAHFRTLLLPERGNPERGKRKENNPAVVSMREESAEQGALRLDYPDSTYFVGISAARGALTCRGAAAVVAASSSRAGERPRWFAAVEGRSAHFRQTPLFLCDTPTGHLEARRDGDTLRVHVEGPGQNLRINALGARWIVLNGKNRRSAPAGTVMIGIVP